MCRRRGEGVWYMVVGSTFRNNHGKMTFAHIIATRTGDTVIEQ